MSKILSWFVTIPLALVIIVFSLVNRGPVAVDFWPLPVIIDIPLFALVLVILAIGVLWGGVGAWLAAGRARTRSRDASRRADAADTDIRHLEERNSRLQEELKEARAIKPDATLRANSSPALPPPADAA